jgi:hypothetical protein
MTDEEMRNLHSFAMVLVTAKDYTYDGWLVSVFEKTSGQWRCVVEDDCGRLFIHNVSQLSVGWLCMRA